MIFRLRGREEECDVLGDGYAFVVRMRLAVGLRGGFTEVDGDQASSNGGGGAMRRSRSCAVRCRRRLVPVRADGVGHGVGGALTEATRSCRAGESSFLMHMLLVSASPSYGGRRVDLPNPLSVTGRALVPKWTWLFGRRPSSGGKQDLAGWSRYYVRWSTADGYVRVQMDAIGRGVRGALTVQATRSCREREGEFLLLVSALPSYGGPRVDIALIPPCGLLLYQTAGACASRNCLQAGPYTFWFPVFI
ncbi:hypothetical protein B0H12DRAFT_486182 [Mycena haematopus]|nr:hypothetical protein B0H12DRAFT_486182 [Mycena haematopus]